MIEETLKQILEEQKKTNALLEHLAIINTEDPKMNDLLTPKQISEQYNITPAVIYRIFKDPTLEVQCWEKFLESSHDELCN